MTLPTTDQRPPKILLRFVITAGKPAMLLEFALYQIEAFLAHNRRDRRHQNPVLWWPSIKAPIAASHRFEG
jgi:hypothetical protein